MLRTEKIVTRITFRAAQLEWNRQNKPDQRVMYPTTIEAVLSKSWGQIKPMDIGGEIFPVWISAL